MPLDPSQLLRDRLLDRGSERGAESHGRSGNDMGRGLLTDPAALAQSSGPLPTLPTHAPGTVIRVRAPRRPRVHMPPLNNRGPNVHPSLPEECERNRIYAIPSTISTTSGTVLSSRAYSAGMRGVRDSIAIARTEGVVHAADNLEHWADGSGSLKWMPVAPFLDPLNRLTELIEDKHIPLFRRGIESRIRSRSQVTRKGLFCRPAQFDSCK